MHGASVLSVAPLLPLMWWMSCGGVAALLSTPVIAFGLLCKVAPSTAFGGWCVRPGQRGAPNAGRAGRCSTASLSPPNAGVRGLCDAGLWAEAGLPEKASTVLRPLLRTRQGPACMGRVPCLP